MLSLLYAVLAIYTLALAFDFAAGLIQLWCRHSVLRQQSISYFPDADSRDTLKVANATESLSQSRVSELTVLQNVTRAELSVETLTPAIEALPSTVAELRLLAQQRHVKGARAMRKEELLAVLR